MACLGGHEELARLLITKYNCPVDVVNKNNRTPLHNACSIGHSPIIKMLASEFKANLMARDNENDTPINIVALNGHEDALQMLITKLGCSPQIKGFDGRSLLHQACLKGHTKLVTILITNFGLESLSVDDSGNTPLHMACWGGHEELARLLITKYNCHVNVKNEEEQTPFHMACSHGHLYISRMLVSECILEDDKSFCNALDKDNNTPLDLLIEWGDANAVHTLSSEYGLKPNVRGAESKPLLHQLAAGGFTTVLQELISKFNYDPACTDEDGNTILHTAAEHGHYEVAEFLITNHSNQFPIDCKNSQGQTALHCACIRGHTRVAKLLVTNKADITVRDEDGDTPLKKAFITRHVLTLFELFNSNFHRINHKLLRQVCESGYTDLIDILLSEFHLKPSSVLDNEGNKAIHIAAHHGHEQVITLLVKKYKCPIDSRNANGQTPLHLLCSQSPTDNHIRMSVSEFKADVTITDNSGDQPVHAAAQAGHTSTVVSLILDHRVNPISRGFKKRSLLHAPCSCKRSHLNCQDPDR